MSREHTIELEKNTTLEIAYIGIIEGKQQQLFEQYFPAVLPVGAEYGGKSLGSLTVTDSDSEAQLVGLFGWPRVEAFLDFHDDPRYVEAAKVRDDALNYLDPANFFTIAEEVDATFHENRIYSVWTGWTQPGADGKLDEYLAAVLPAALASGMREIVSLRAAAADSQVQAQIDKVAAKPNGGAPDVVRILEWPSAEARDAFLRSDVYADAADLREESLSRFIDVLTVFPFPDEETR